MPYVLLFCAYSSKASILIFCILEEPFVHSDDIYVEKENVDKYFFIFVVLEKDCRTLGENNQGKFKIWTWSPVIR